VGVVVIFLCFYWTHILPTVSLAAAGALLTHTAFYLLGFLPDKFKLELAIREALDKQVREAAKRPAAGAPELTSP
jgi:hypothetical protein